MQLRASRALDGLRIVLLSIDLGVDMKRTCVLNFSMYLWREIYDAIG